MIDPTVVTKFDRTDVELQEYWLFCLVVAGKTAVVQARLLDNFLYKLTEDLDSEITPFQAIAYAVSQGTLLQTIKDSRLGQYTRLERAFKLSTSLDLKNCSVDDLEAIPGVGAKTARYFLLHSRAGQRIAVLDTHMIRYMRDLGLTTLTGTPPSGPKYKTLEDQFIKLADASGMSVADFDLMLWNKYARKA
jgi:thermostable 8-oxoguanine DNA glycosylase